VKKWSSANWPGVVLPNSLAPDEDGEGAFSVRDWIEGLPFSEIMARRSVMPSEAEARREFAEICDALQRFHSAGEVHGAIRPSNLLFTAEGIRLTDPDPLQPTNADPYYTKSRDEVVFSAIEHLNPEAWLEKKQMPASDIYSLASIYVHWVTGAPPFPGDYPLLVCYQHLGHTTALKPSKLISKYMAEVLNRALDKNPLNRHEDARELAHALREGLVDTEASLETSTAAMVREASPEVWRPEETRTVLFRRHEIELGAMLASQYPDLPIDEARARLLDALGDPFERAPIPIVRPGQGTNAASPEGRGLPMPKTAPRKAPPPDPETESVDEARVRSLLSKLAAGKVDPETEDADQDKLVAVLARIAAGQQDPETEAVDEGAVRALLAQIDADSGSADPLDGFLDLLTVAVKKGASHSPAAARVRLRLTQLGLDPDATGRLNTREIQRESRDSRDSAPTLKRLKSLEDELDKDPFKVPFIIVATWAAIVTIIMFVNLISAMNPAQTP
jgi:hypothetical protein